jgi:hypothetical protein
VNSPVQWALGHRPACARPRAGGHHFTASGLTGPHHDQEGPRMGSVIKKRRKRMSKKKHRKLLRKTRVQRRRLGK